MLDTCLLLWKLHRRLVIVSSSSTLESVRTQEHELIGIQTLMKIGVDREFGIECVCSGFILD